MCSSLAFFAYTFLSSLLPPSSKPSSTASRKICPRSLATDTPAWPLSMLPSLYQTGSRRRSCPPSGPGWRWSSELSPTGKPAAISTRLLLPPAHQLHAINAQSIDRSASDARSPINLRRNFNILETHALVLCSLERSHDSDYR